MSTSAVPVALALTLPDPAIETLACSALTPDASIPPDPAISYSATFALPVPLLIPPEPPIDSLSDWTSVAASSSPPDPAIEPSNELPATRSTLIPPDPAMVAPRSCGHGDHEVRLAVVPAGVEPAFLLLGPDRRACRPSPRRPYVRAASRSRWRRRWGWSRCGLRRHTGRRPRSSGTRRPDSCGRRRDRRLRHGRARIPEGLAAAINAAAAMDLRMVPPVALY